MAAGWAMGPRGASAEGVWAVVAMTDCGESRSAGLMQLMATGGIATQGEFAVSSSMLRLQTRLTRYWVLLPGVRI